MVELLEKGPEVSLHEEAKDTKVNFHLSLECHSDSHGTNMGQDGANTAEDPTERVKDHPAKGRVWMFTGIGITILALLVTVIAVPAIIHSNRTITTPKAGLAIDKNFPDPSLVYFNDTWYAFATNSIVNGLSQVFHVPVAMSSDFQHWNVTDEDALPTLADWETSKDHWAPDVVQRVSYPTISSGIL